MVTVFTFLGEQLRMARKRRAVTQSDLAYRVGRDKARISELERDLFRDRRGRDRLTLLAELCDALDLMPLLIPKNRLAEAEGLFEIPSHGAPATRVETAFDDLFIDLDDQPGEDE